jgi:hypothetical protein
MSAFLVQILLPLNPPSGTEGHDAYLRAVRIELTERFGGITVYLNSPADGLWKDGEERLERDEVVIYEVMVDDLERRWWSGFRERVRLRLRQEELVVRAIPIERL